jgi:hypothetical protein
MRNANLVLRFLLELGGIASFAYWGLNAFEGTVPRIAVAIAAPVALIIVWGLVVAPKARNRIGQTARVLIGSGLLALAAVALFAVGEVAWAIGFAILNAANTALILVLGGPTEWSA